MSEWKKVKLGEICERVTSGGTPKANVSSYYNPPKIPWLKTKEVNYCRITETENYISEEGLNNSSAKFIAPNSVIIAMYGQGDTAGRVAINKIPLTTNQACCNLTINKDKADYEFIYYQLCTLYNKMVSLKAGAAQPNLNAQIIKNLDILLPTLIIQHRIAAILSRYDTLIENYQKQIKLLEEAAQRLYKEWFVNLRFPGNENTKIVDGVPEGWEKKTIGEIAEINKRNISKDYQYSYLDYTDLGNVSSGRIDNPKRYAYGEEPGRAKRTVQDGDVIWGMVRPNLKSYALVQYPKQQDVFSTGFAILTAKHVPFSFLYCSVITDSFVGYLVNCTNGAAYPAVKPEHFSKAQLVIPTDDIMIMYNELAEPMFRQVNRIQSQIRLLTEARDRLLPKLMSGEISVGTAQSVTSGLGVRKEQTGSPKPSDS